MFSKQVDPLYLPVIHMGAACAGEIVSYIRWAELNTFYLLMLGHNHQRISQASELYFFDTALVASHN
jgi:hypothetical protein